MDDFNYCHGRLSAEQVDLSEIATQYGTPCSRPVTCIPKRR